MAGVNILTKIGAIALLALAGTIKAEDFTGYKVYEVTPKNFIQATLLQQYSEDPRYDFWKESRLLGSSSHIMVSPADQLEFEDALLRKGFTFTILISNVEEVLLQERTERSLLRSTVTLGDVTFGSFMYHSEQMAYLRRIAEAYPDLTSLENIGESHEGREILLLKISSGPSATSVPKPLILVDAGIHCREWIAPPVALYIINQLVENSTNAALYENVDWAVIPNLNPDGYEYTQYTNRLWRKNRRLTDGASCYGTDLNRNFGYYWMYAGASNNSCSETFAGPEAFSEPEARALRDWVQANKENMHLYLTFHSYGQYLLYPWGYAAVYPDNADELQSVADAAAAALASSSTLGSSYYVGNSAAALYAAAGASDDWVKSEGVDLSYTVELPNTGAPYAFMIPAKNILPVVQETFSAVLVFHQYVEEKYWLNNTSRFLRNVI